MAHARLRGWLVVFLFCVGLAGVLPLVGRGDDPVPAGRKYALLVGVKNYDKDQLRSLRFTEADVNGLAAVLKDADYKRVVLMTQSEAVSAGDNTLQPTAKNIRKKLAAILDDRKPGDAVLIAFSGHGVQFRDQKASFFCPMDADLTDNNTLVSLGEVYKALEESGAGMRVLLVDACRNDPQSETAKAVDKVKLDSVTRPQEVAPPGGVAALFSCSAGQKSYESEKLGHGVFFHYVIEGLKGEAANKKGEVTLQGLAAYVSDEVPDAAKDVSDAARQRPQQVGNLSGALPLVTRGDRDDLTNSLGMKLKRIRPGKFLMGSPKDEEGRKDDEGPQHEVEITKAFYMGVYPVTKGQFAAFVKDNGYTVEAEEYDKKWTWQNPFFLAEYHQTENDPLVRVTWNDAVKFCLWVSGKEKKVYELPTQEEWEYACRAGTTTAFSFPDPKDLDGYAWYNGNSGGHTHPVGGKKPNPWGLYDMHGNVTQWCADVLGNGHICRGGSWQNEARFCRSAFRSWGLVSAPGDGNGIRVVMRPSARTR